MLHRMTWVWRLWHKDEPGIPDQMPPNPQGISHVSIQKRRHRNCLDRGNKSWKAIGRIGCQSHSSGPLIFFRATLARSWWFWINFGAQPRPVASRDVPAYLTEPCQSQSGVKQKHAIHREKTFSAFHYCYYCYNVKMLPSPHFSHLSFGIYSVVFNLSLVPSVCCLF